MLRIEKFALREIHLPLREPFAISSGTQSLRRIGLLEITDADGAVACSECVASEEPNYSPETVETAWHAIREWIAPLVRGREFQDPAAIHTLLLRHIRGHQMARAAIEMASWGLLAQRNEVSLASLLGGTRQEIATGISVGIQSSPETLVDKARGYLEHGYRKLKMKIKPGADFEYVAAVREEFGSQAPLMADANNAYRLQDLELLQRLDELGLMMIEQPLAWNDLVRHAELQSHLRTPICLDESIMEPEHAEDMLTLNSGRIINIKPGRVGGFTASIAIHDLCQRHGVPVWCGGMLESGVGRAYNVALASLPNFTLPGDLSPSARYWERDIVTPEWTMSSDGMVKVPYDRPGIGVAIDLDRIDDLTVRQESF